MALMTQGMGKAEVLNAFFAPDFARKICLQKYQAMEAKRKVWSQKMLTLGRRGPG